MHLTRKGAQCVEKVAPIYQFQKRFMLGIGIVMMFMGCILYIISTFGLWTINVYGNWCEKKKYSIELMGVDSYVIKHSKEVDFGSIIGRPLTTGNCVLIVLI